MTVAAIGENQIARILVIELVDLVAAFEDRHVPFEQIDEHRFARREHRTEHAVRGRTRAELKRVQHVLGSLTVIRSEEHTSELQSLMRISYAVFCLKKKITNTNTYYNYV